jgi:uncharacterized protein YybS (DUF2232 family)
LSVNHSASEIRTGEVATPVARSHRVQEWLIVACMLLFPALKVGPQGQTQAIVVAMMLGAVVYLLATYLYFGIATLAYRRSTYLVWFGGIGGMVIGYFVSGIDNLWYLICGWSMVFIAAAAVGRMAAEGRARLTVYLTGAAIVTAVVLALYASKWVQIMNLAGAFGDLLIRDTVSNLQANGYTAEMVKTYSDAMKKLLDVLTRLVPASMLLGSIAQYSIGYLWFYGRTARSETEASPMESFVMWKMPFGVIPVVIIGVIVRLTGGETLKLCADNLLAVPAVFYCVTGLALIEFYMQRLGLPRFMRIMFYLLLFFTQIAGFIATVLLGFIDSFADWRRIDGPKSSVENEDGSVY